MITENAKLDILYMNASRERKREDREPRVIARYHELLMQQPGVFTSTERTSRVNKIMHRLLLFCTSDVLD